MQLEEGDVACQVLSFLLLLLWPIGTIRWTTTLLLQTGILLYQLLRGYKSSLLAGIKEYELSCDLIAAVLSPNEYSTTALPVSSTIYILRGVVGGIKAKQV